jgi:hypothetical protein
MGNASSYRQIVDSTKEILSSARVENKARYGDFFIDAQPHLTLGYDELSGIVLRNLSYLTQGATLRENDILGFR